MDQLFDEMKDGGIRTYSEMLKRKEELLNTKRKTKRVAEAKGVAKLFSTFIFLIIVFSFVLLSINFYSGLRNPILQSSYNDFSVESDPIQTETKAPSFSYSAYWKKWYLTPVADYKIVAQVKSKNHIGFFQDDTSELAKYDLALAWGKLVEPAYDEYIKYSQWDRKYFFEYSEDCPLSKSYISNHSSNNHIIAANKTVLRGIKNIKKNDIIYMEGHLVNVFNETKDGYNVWNTSLTRDDSGDGGCEVFYVKKLQIGSKTYE